MSEHIIDGERYTGRCEAGHVHTFEVARFHPMVPVDCPTCRDEGYMSGSFRSRLIYDEPKPFRMTIERVDIDA